MRKTLLVVFIDTSVNSDILKILNVSKSSQRRVKCVLPVIKAVCSSPQAIFKGTSFLSQNLLGTFSANLLFPKVKTAPDSDREEEESQLLNYRKVFNE